jgi:hypothetical protein
MTKVKGVFKTVEPIYEDGEWWYYRPEGSKVKRERLSQYASKNSRRMWVNGKYIPTSHPLWKPGRYKSLDDAWSHEQIERTSEGEVYAIVNPAFPDWIKVGKAVNADDRCNGYQTSSPFRDYSIIARLTTDNRHEKEAEMHRIFTHFSEDRKGEWFKIDKLKAIKIFNHQAKTFFQQLSKGLQDAA